MLEFACDPRMGSQTEQVTSSEYLNMVMERTMSLQAVYYLSRRFVYRTHLMSGEGTYSSKRILML